MEAHYQPIVDLETRAVVAYEALAREDGAFPAARFAAARATGGLPELDAECQRLAFAGAEGLASTLFVNVEPACFAGPPPGGPANVIVELTERELTARPAELLLAVERVRARGWGVAVDDVGVDWRSLALLPLLRPDVVKLDRSVLAHADAPEAARVVRGARAHVERHGGLLLAEGIEDAEHESRARAFGARLGQGWRFGRPAPLGPEARSAAAEPLVSPREPIGEETPLQLLRGHALGTGTKRELLAFSMDLEREALAMRDPSVVLGTFQHARHFTSRTRERYAGLAAGAAFVAAFGVGLDPSPPGGARRQPARGRGAGERVVRRGGRPALGARAHRPGPRRHGPRHGPPVRVRAHRGPRPRGTRGTRADAARRRRARAVPRRAEPPFTRAA